MNSLSLKYPTSIPKRKVKDKLESTISAKIRCINQNKKKLQKCKTEKHCAWILYPFAHVFVPSLVYTRLNQQHPLETREKGTGNKTRYIKMYMLHRRPQQEHTGKDIVMVIMDLHEYESGKVLWPKECFFISSKTK